MRKLVLIVALFACIQSIQAQVPLSDLKKGQLALITLGSHDSWLIMNQENEVSFLSPHTGKVNLYSIDLDDLKFVETNREGLLMAEYLANDQYLKKYTPLTEFTDGAMDSPEYSPAGDLIAIRRYVKDTAVVLAENQRYPPWKFSMVIVDTETKEATTVLEKEVSCFTFLTDSTILYQQSEEDSSWLKRININTKKVENFIQSSSVLRGITSNEDIILVHENEKALIYDRTTKELLNTIDIPASMQRVSLLGKYLTLTPRNQPSSFMKISNGELTPIVGSYDYEPSVSRDQEYILVVSESAGGGILYKR